MSANELSAERRAQIRENGTQQALFTQHDSTGYREPSVESASYPFLPLCDEAHTTSR